MPKPRPAAAPTLIARLSLSVAGLLGRKAKPSPGPAPRPKAKSVAKPTPGHPVAPTKADTALLPRFEGLPPERIHVPKTKAECAAAEAEIVAAGVAGFDTEARPTFRAGEQSTGPHVVQFALTNCAFLFQLHRRECLETVARLIASGHVRKVGFGLANDHGQIRHRLGVQIENVVDLDHVFRRRGYRGQIGVRGAMGTVLGLNFPKSKAITTSNWAARELTASQLRYAANDAFAALKIFEALDLDPSEISTSARKRRRRARRPKQA